MKSEKNIVRDILIAQGLPWNTEPTPEAIKVLRDFGFAKWQEGGSDARYEVAEWN